MHVIGLDLGQQGDYSALANLQYELPALKYRMGSDTPESVPLTQYEVPTLKRWPLGTSYTQVGRDVARFLSQPTMREADLVVDETGVGIAVVELIERELRDSKVANRLIRVTITGGNAVTNPKPRKWHVSKKQLVSVLSAVVHGGRMKVARGQPEAEVLVKEMGTFKVKVNLATGNEEFSAWREKDHDDLVLAVALATWWPERPRPRAGAAC